MSRSSAVEVATKHLGLAIAQARARGAMRLPTVRQLARSAGVSHGAISRALAGLRDSGRVLARPSRGIVLPPEQPAAPAVPEPDTATRWQHLCRRLHTDLMRGNFGFASPLPSGKELSARYGVSGRTLRKALRELVRAEVLVPYRRTYALAHARGQRARDTIALFTRGTPDGRIQDYSGRTGGYVTDLEQQARSRGVSLRVVSVYFDDATLWPPSDQNERGLAGIDPSRVLGCMVWQQDLDRHSVDAVLAWARRYDIPAAALCEWDPPYWRDAPRARNFMLTHGSEVGAEIGRYLLGLGHRSVCCVSAHPGVDWSTDRIEGVRRAYAQAGDADGVLVRIGQVDPMWPHLHGLPRWMARAEATAGRTVGALERDNALAFQATSRQEVQDTCIAVTNKELTRHAVQSLLPEVLRNGTTALACVNDAVAVECLVWLRQEGVDVPRQMSVVGVDNSMAAAYHQLTSYSFNAASAMHLMVEYLLRPDTPMLHGDANAPVRIRGYVHERASTGTAAGVSVTTARSSDRRTPPIS